MARDLEGVQGTHEGWGGNCLARV